MRKGAMYLIQTISLLVVFFYTVDSDKYIQQNKRSVFDIIMNTDQENIKVQHFEISKYATVLSKVTEVGKLIKYEKFRNIFLTQKPQQREKPLIFELRRHEMKKQFLKARKSKNKTNFKERGQETTKLC